MNQLGYIVETTSSRLISNTCSSWGRVKIIGDRVSNVVDVSRDWSDIRFWRRMGKVANLILSNGLIGSSNCLSAFCSCRGELADLFEDLAFSFCSLGSDDCFE